MTMINVPIGEATVGQLRYYAEVVLGLDLGPNPNIKPETIIAKIGQAGHDGPTIQVPAPADATEAEEPLDANPEHALSPGSYQRSHAKRWVQIDAQEGPGGKEPVQVAVNGTLILVPRGRPVELAEPYVEVLENAEKTVHDYDPEAHTLTPRSVPAYPMRLMRG